MEYSFDIFFIHFNTYFNFGIYLFFLLRKEEGVDTFKHNNLFNLVRMRGLEPRKQRPKRCVLPLHHTLKKLTVDRRNENNSKKSLT